MSDSQSSWSLLDPEHWLWTSLPLEYPDSGVRHPIGIGSTYRSLDLTERPVDGPQPFLWCVNLNLHNLHFCQYLIFVYSLFRSLLGSDLVYVVSLLVSSGPGWKIRIVDTEIPFLNRLYGNPYVVHNRRIKRFSSLTTYWGRFELSDFHCVMTIRFFLLLLVVISIEGPGSVIRLAKCV